MINPLLGVAIGDALGMPFEMMGHDDPRLLAWDGETFHDLKHDHHGPLKAGQFTDDTQMTLALAESMIEAKGYDIDKAAAKYLVWFQGEPRGMGPMVKAALEKLIEGATPHTSGIVGAKGTGTAMRAIPLGVYPYSWRNMLDACRDDAQITHRSPEAVDAAVEVAELAWNLLHMSMGATSLRASHAKFRQEAKSSELVIAEEKTLAEDRGTGIALIESAKWCFFTTDTFKDAVRAAIRLGGDTDTRAAIVGGWAGIRYGVPDDWARQVEDYERILKLEDQFLRGGG